MMEQSYEKSSEMQKNIRFFMPRRSNFAILGVEILIKFNI